MKKILFIIFLGLLSLNTAYADDSYETAFKKALKDHQYYFKYKDKTYTTNTKEKPFDFFDNGYNYHEASLYMKNNYIGPSDGNYGCMNYNGLLYQFRKSESHKYDYLDYDKNGWKKTIIANSEDNLVKVFLIEAPLCLGLYNYIQIYFNDKEIFDSRPDVKKWTSDRRKIGFNINLYIDKDYNQNGIKELFIDAAFLVNNVKEIYYFFEYDTTSIKLVKKILAENWKEKLGVSDHFKKKFEVSEEDLIKVITKNFNENDYVECIEGDCINGKGIFDGKNGDKYVGEFKDGKYHGQGIETNRNGAKYVGEFKDGLNNGHGTQIYEDGEKYVGEFKDGAINGQGTYTFSNEDKYIGEWKDGLHNGQGTKIYADGDKYIGGWKDGRKTGQGTLTYADGTKFTGEWNEYDGIFIYTDGTKFVGEWDWKRDGKPIK